MVRRDSNRWKFACGRYPCAPACRTVVLEPLYRMLRKPGGVG